MAVSGSSYEVSHQVIECDMPDGLREATLKIFTDAAGHWKCESEMATAIKTALDARTQAEEPQIDERQKMGPKSRWNCLVGKSFACYFSHDAETFLQAKFIRRADEGEESKLIIVFRAS